MPTVNVIARIVLFVGLAASLLISGAAYAGEVKGEVVALHGADEFGIGGIELRPASSIEHREDIGGRAHTNLRIMIPNTGSNANSNLNTPSSIACVYNLVPQPAKQPAGCNPLQTSVNPTGGAGAIAIVDAYDDPTATADLAYFSSYFGLAKPMFQVVYAGGAAPYINGPQPPSGAANGWNIEEALDIEWAHAMAPGAKIFLVEAQSNSYADLFTAIMAAEYLVSKSGGGEISMSWGGSEFSGETSFDAYFEPANAPANVVFVASAGDNDSVEYPAASPYVVSVGGTTLNRNANGAFVSETAWSGSGGGVSMYESRPSYQGLTSVENVVGAHRGTPDISLVADPNTGVAIYEAGVWYSVGGTSVAAPSNAGILNVADSEAKNFPAPAAELTRLYDDGGHASYFRDITSGTCGSDSAMPGYDLCTGLGSPLAYADLEVLNPSPNDTAIPPASMIVDSQLNEWTVAGGIIYENGTATPSGSVILLLYYGNVIYQENAAGNWWAWESGKWVASKDPQPSANGTEVPPAANIIDSQLNKWTLSKGYVYENGTETPSASVILLVYENNKVYQENSSHNWWYWNGSKWIATASPIVIAAK